MAQAGIHPKVMQGRSGHKDSRTTLDVYTRYQPGMDAVAADAMEAIYRKSAANGDQGSRSQAVGARLRSATRLIAVGARGFEPRTSSVAG